MWQSDETVQPFLWPVPCWVNLTQARIREGRALWEKYLYNICLVASFWQFLSFYCFNYLFVMCTEFWLHVCFPGSRGRQSHCKWLWAIMWLLGIELSISRRATSALILWAIFEPRAFLNLWWMWGGSRPLQVAHRWLAILGFKRMQFSQVVEANTFNLAHSGSRGSRITVSSRAAWSSKGVPEQSPTYRETLSGKTK